MKTMRIVEGIAYLYGVEDCKHQGVAMRVSIYG